VARDPARFVPALAPPSARSARKTFQENYYNTRDDDKTASMRALPRDAFD
jgi:hypothetical protein